jgi:hypothetical protein
VYRIDIVIEHAYQLVPTTRLLGRHYINNGIVWESISLHLSASSALTGFPAKERPKHSGWPAIFASVIFVNVALMAVRKNG